MTVADLIEMLMRMPRNSIVEYEGYPINYADEDGLTVTLTEFRCCEDCG